MSADDKAAAAWNDYVSQQQEEKIEELERELNAANDRIKRLEEAGDYLCAAAAFMGWHDKIETWNKAKEATP